MESVLIRIYNSKMNPRKRLFIDLFRKRKENEIFNWEYIFRVLEKPIPLPF